MTFLPIVERELRERARWRSTYWVRGLAALLASGVAGFVLMFIAAASPGAVGHGMMETLAWIAFPFAVLEGLRNTADSLSEEKREGTLGLLFLTDLKGYDVVLGKFFASSLTSFYALLAMLPALAIPVLLGGVTGAEFWRLVFALVNALFFSLTTGTFVSAISREERRAWSGTFALVLLFTAVIPVVSQSFHIPVIWLFSPFTAFWLHDATSYAGAAQKYWNSLWATQAVSWTWLALASFLLPRVWQESGSRRTERRRRAHPERDRQRRREQLAINPIWWLTSRNNHQRVWLWLIVSCACVAGVFGFFFLQDSSTGLWSMFGLALALHLGLGVWVASEASNSFAEARAAGAMELLLSTPLHVRQILRGQHLALRELFLGPVLLLVGVEVFLSTLQIWSMTQQGDGVPARVILILVIGFCLVWFVLDLFAAAEVGMWFGLTSAKPTQALTKTVLFVLILPLVFLPCCWFVGPGLMVAKGVIFFTWAQTKLECNFRLAATQRFEKPTATWLRKTPGKLTMPGEENSK